MKKVLEIVLVSLTIILSSLLTYYQVNRLEGISTLYIIFYSSIIVLSVFYATGIKNKIALVFHTLFIFGLIANLFHMFHWPGGGLTLLLHIGMLGTSFLCVASTEVLNSKRTQKLFIQLIGICILISTLGFFIDLELIQLGSFYISYVILGLLLIFLANKNRIRYSIENNLKTFLVYFIATIISMLNIYIK